MHRERVSENVFWFQSEVYAQVTAGVVAGTQWAVVIDTLALPDETLTIREFIEHELNVPVRYVINTHYHADHLKGLACDIQYKNNEQLFFIIKYAIASGFNRLFLYDGFIHLGYGNNKENIFQVKE